MKWYSVEIDDDFGVREFIQYLHQNEVKFETSDLYNGGKHFEIYCDEKMAKTLDDALDVMFAIQNSNSLDEATNNVK